VSEQLLRVMDANVNRCREGLRVLEDVARFVLNDAQLSQRLKTLRHDLTRETKQWDVKLLSHRNAEHDVGIAQPANRGAGVKAAWPQGLLDLVAANAKRVEESLRVIEEVAKLPEVGSASKSAVFERMRFTTYALERDLISRISRQDKIQRITGLYVVLDREFLGGRDELDVARQIIEGGATVIQLRDKSPSCQDNKRHLLAVARKVKELCSRANVLFVINDYLDLALAVDADGLHVGQKDLPIPIIRRKLPIDKIVGCSVRTLSQAQQAQKQGADYLAVGSIFPTTTKRGATVVGVHRIRELKGSISLPVVVIGGINESNIDEVVSAGADAVAVISAVLSEKDIKGIVRRLIAKIELAKGRCQNQ
jgi:thiamine-phosphate pyrophosphorylase